MKQFLTLIIGLVMGLTIYPLKAQQTNFGVEFSEAIMQRHPGTINDLTGKGWEYSNSIVLYGMQKIYQYTNNPDYLAYIKKYVDLFVDAQGNISFDSSANNLDHLHPGLLCLFLYEQTGIDRYRIAAEKIRQEFDKQPRNPSGGYWHKERYANQMWADGIYMAEPFLVQYGSMFNDEAYTIDEASKQVLLLADNAYDSTINLIYHGWDETLAATWADENGRSPEVWSRGMGWYCMALVDILDYIPETDTRFNHFVSLIQGLAKGIKTYQDDNSGLWYQVVDKGNISTNWIETSGSAMFIYMLKKGVDKGYLDSTYIDVVDKGWAGMQKRVTLDSKSQPVINDFVKGMGIKDSYSVYVSQTKVSTPSSRYPHGYCAILSLASVMEWPKDKINQLIIDVEGQGEVVTEEQDTMFMSGRYVCLKARNTNSSSFVGWTGDVQSSDSIIWVKMDSTINIKATFLSDATLDADVCGVEEGVYPNPTQGMITVKGLNSNLRTKYTIRSASGSIVASGIAIAPVIDVSNLSSGYYILEFSNQKYSFIKQ